MIALFHTCAMLCYWAASVVLAAAFAGRTSLLRAGIPIVAIGAVLHAAGLIAYTHAFGEMPLVGLAPSLSTISFIITVFVLLSAVAQDARSIALLVLPVVAVLLTIAFLLAVVPTGQPMAFRGPWFALHVLFAFAAYGGLTVSAAAGVLYLLQFRELKGKHLGRVFRFLPPLPTLDRIGRAGLLVGFPSLTVAVIVGWGWTVLFGQTAPSEGAQVIWAVVTWSVFALMVAARAMSPSGRERRAALVSVMGFVIVVVAYIVLRMSPAAQGGFL